MQTYRSPTDRTRVRFCTHVRHSKLTQRSWAAVGRATRTLGFSPDALQGEHDGGDAAGGDDLSGPYEVGYPVQRRAHHLDGLVLVGVGRGHLSHAVREEQIGPVVL